MKKLLFLFSAITLFSVLNAQVITFRRGYFVPVYSDAGHYSTANYVYAEQADDDGYYIGGKRTYDTVLTLYKTDKYGVVQNRKNIPAEGTLSSMIKVSGNKFFLCMGNNLYSLDQDFNIIFAKQLDTANVTYSIMQSVDQNLILAGISVFGEIKIRRLNFTGETLWSRSYYTNQKNPQYRGILVRPADDGFAVLINQRLYRFSAAGDSLWCTLFSSPTLSFNYNGQCFLISADNRIIQTDVNGKVQWSKMFENIFDLCVSAEGNFAGIGNNLYKLNSSGDTLWTRQSMRGRKIKVTKDNGFIMTYLSDFHITLYKTDENGKYQEIQITYPYTGNEKNVSINEEIKIEWQKLNVDFVDLSFSSDGGSSWNQIASKVPGTFCTWRTPSKQIENCILQITDWQNSLVSSCIIFNIAYNKTKEVIRTNRISMCFGNDGISSHNSLSDGSGLYWPDDNEYHTAVFQDGLVWGGIVNGEIRVNGSTYRSGLRPGTINKTGTSDDPSDIKNNIWRLRKDWESLPEGVERDRNEYNYRNWPGDLGAPFEDIDRDGKFTRDVDKPMIYGDETFWFAANDLDTTTSRFCYGSDPIGIEMQCTVYGYNRSDELGDVIFKKYKIINKSGSRIEKVCLGYWSDPDLGFAIDDYVGCDSVLSIAYCYNGDNNDENFYGTNPPALGYALLDGPSMSGFIFYAGASSTWRDPVLGSPEGAIQFYNYLNGRLYDGSEVIDPITNQVSRYWLDGDPVSGTGWYEGNGWPGGEPPNDRRMMLITGPDDFNVKDTMQVTLAIVMAQGSDNINSVKVLKDKVKAVRNFYYNGILNGAEPEKNLILRYSLEQNYPNPFNPSTTIKYTVPEKGLVELNIYDVLGKKVMTLVNEEKSAGEYSTNLNARSLSSGVYYYQLKTKDYISTKKMILIK